MWKLAWIQYLKKDYPKAAQGFQEAGKISKGWETSQRLPLLGGKESSSCSARRRMRRPF